MPISKDMEPFSDGITVFSDIVFSPDKTLVLTLSMREAVRETERTKSFDERVSELKKEQERKAKSSSAPVAIPANQYKTTQIGQAPGKWDMVAGNVVIELTLPQTATSRSMFGQDAIASYIGSRPVIDGTLNDQECLSFKFEFASCNKVCFYRQQ